MEFEERVFCGGNVTLKRREEDCTVYKMEDDTGEGTMTCYNVFPGIDIMYNDFHMQSCYSQFEPKVEMLGIDHCREGRIEWEFSNNTYMYLQQGDLQIDAKNNHQRSFGFPLSHYHGITVAMYVEEASKALSTVFEGWSVDLRELRSKFCAKNAPLIMRADDSIEHIFSELYSVPKTIRKHYYKIKVLELLLFLSVVDVAKRNEDRAYYTKMQVDTVKAMMQYMTQHIDKHFTLEELASRFNMPLTTMKNCFKGIYGTSIYAYMRAYRMQTAAFMLRQTDDSVTSIAMGVGYNNTSKFAAAFQDVMELTPSKFRKTFV